jgi:hypothetical protein
MKGISVYQKKFKENLFVFLGQAKSDKILHILPHITRGNYDF